MVRKYLRIKKSGHPVHAPAVSSFGSPVGTGLTSGVHSYRITVEAMTGEDSQDGMLSGTTQDGKENGSRQVNSLILGTGAEGKIRPFFGRDFL